MKRNSLIICAMILLVLIIAVSCMAEDNPVNKPKLVKDTYPALSSGTLMNAKLASLPMGVLLQSGSTKISQKDLDSEINKAPKEMRAQLKKNSFFMLEQMSTGKLIEAEAKAWAVKNNKQIDSKAPKFIDEYIDSLVAPVTVSDAEVNEFYEKNKDMVGGASFDQIKDMLKGFVLNEKRQKFVDDHINSLGTRVEINISETWASKQYPLAIDNIVDKARTSGKPSMIDFGAEGCGPCDMMTPILAELKLEYADKANVLFVPVREEQILAARYGIQSIPVQVFFDKDGKEVFRHVGFYPKDQIVAKLTEMGAQ